MHRRLIRGCALPMTAPDNLAFLLGRIALGDKKAMRAMYMSLGPELHRFIQTRLSDPHEASDILQETMLEVWRQADAFEGRSSARTWIFSIARNKAIDRVRRRVPTIAEPDETVPDEAPDPYDTLAALDDGAALRTCVEQLTDVQRAVIHLAFFKDLPYSEIAEIEGCSVGTVKTRVHHAKKLLMHCLSSSVSREK